MNTSTPTMTSLLAELMTIGAIPEALRSIMNGERESLWPFNFANSGALGAERFFFWYIAHMLREPTIYLRERDLTYFGVEEWPNPQIACVNGEGEVPFLYKLTLSNVGALADVSRELLVLLDFLHRTTGSGLGTSPPTRGGPSVAASGLRFDIKDSRRYRYNTRRIGEAFWIERADAGRISSVGGVNLTSLSHSGFNR